MLTHPEAGAPGQDFDSDKDLVYLPVCVLLHGDNELTDRRVSMTHLANEQRRFVKVDLVRHGGTQL